jgi:hypothetical protein
MLRVLIVLIAFAGVTACTNKTEDLRSPCVGTDDSPCVRRAPANQV